MKLELDYLKNLIPDNRIDLMEIQFSTLPRVAKLGPLTNSRHNDLNNIVNRLEKSIETNRAKLNRELLLF